MPIYRHLLPEILPHVAGVLLFFALLLASGVAAFGRSLGPPMHSAVLPLLVVPVVEDWVRFLFHCSFAAAWLAGLLVWFAGVAAKMILAPERGRPRLLVSRRWLAALGIVLLFHLVIRLWIFTGTDPNPRDDLWGGYKANGLLHSTGWPASNAEIPELGFSYYYFAYTWPAGFAAWTGLPLWDGWWPTIIVLSTAGTLLIVEIVLPLIRSRIGVAVAALAATVGASAVLPLDFVFRLQPKFWMEWGTLPAFFVPPSLYVQLPTQMQAIEAPFDVFANGLLFSVTWIVLRARRRVLPWTRWLYLILAVGALAGYSTFHLVGFVLVIAPVLALVPPHRGGRRLVAFAAAGVGALVLAAPLLWEFAHRRGHAVLVPGQLPLYLWVWHHPLALLLRALLGLAFLLVLQNLLGFWAVFAHAPRSAWTRGLRAIFLWGCVTCLWGDQNYVLKMGTFISLAGLALFAFQARRRELALASLCLLGPGLLLLNQIRANFMVEPVDPIWTVLDRITAHSSEMVYYSCDPQSNQKLQPYFSHARFLGPVERLDSQYTVILSDLTALPALPPWPQRVRRLDPGATTVLRLDSPPVDPVPPAVRIYLDPRYSLSREPLPAP